MTDLTLLNVQANGRQVTTTSMAVAERFGKRHDNLVRAIRKLEVDQDWYLLNFEEIQVDTDLGMGRIRKDPAYKITRDGFAILAMGFTGPEAMKWKVAYIRAFNELEQAHYQHLEDKAAHMLMPPEYRPTKPMPLKIRLTLMKQGQDTLAKLQRTAGAHDRRNLYWQLRRINGELGITTPSRQELDVALGFDDDEPL